jgi:glycosyltransferase involved in cell wall biosynthesis
MEAEFEVPLEGKDFKTASGKFIKLAKHSGFCHGVKKAVDKTINASHQNTTDEQPTYVLGQLIHNQQEIERLETMGIRTVQTLAEIPDGANCVIRTHGAPPELITQAEARHKIGEIAVNDFVVLFFGHLEPRKGLMEFLAMAKSAGAQPHLKFLVAGSNDLSRHGRAFVEQLEEARSLPNIVIHDKRIDFECVEYYFSACDSVALPYLEGSTSGVLKLALAFGKPVVATKVGDLPEQIPDGGGILVDCGNHMPTDFLDAINRIKSNYQAYAGIMADARQNADWGDIAKNVFGYLSR